MRYLVLFVYLLITTCICNGMNESDHPSNHQQSKIIHDLLTQHSFNPHIEFITDDQIIFNHNMQVIGQNAYHEGCYILDITKNEIVKKIEIDPSLILKDKYCTLNLAMHPNKKLFSLVQGDYTATKGFRAIALYDTTIGNKIIATTIPSNGLHCYSFFDTSDNHLFYWEHSLPILRKWDYKTQTISKEAIVEHNLYETGIKNHPTKQELCIKHSWTDGTIIYNSDDLTIIKKITPSLYSNREGQPIKYSPDGSFIAIMDGKSIRIIETDSYTISHTYEWQEAQFIDCIAFHPTDPFLAVYVRPDNTIEYCNLKKPYNRIKQPTIIPSTERPDYKYNCSHLDFSPNGTKMLLCVKNKYFFKDVHQDALYLSKAKKVIPYHIFVLKNYLLDQHNSLNQQNQLPYEIIQYLIFTMLETFKYS